MRNSAGRWVNIGVVAAVVALFSANCDCGGDGQGDETRELRAESAPAVDGAADPETDGSGRSADGRDTGAASDTEGGDGEAESAGADGSPSAAAAPADRREARSLEPWVVLSSEGDEPIEVEIGVRLDRSFREKIDSEFPADVGNYERIGTEIPYRPGLLPAPYDETTSLDIVTSEGVFEQPIAAIYVGGGAGPTFFALRVERSPEMPDDEVGWLAAPPGSFDDDASVRPFGADPSAHEKLKASLRDEFLASLSAEGRERAAPKMTTEHVQIGEGTFPSPHAYLVTIDVPLDGVFWTAAALWLVDTEGQITARPGAASVEKYRETYRVEGLVDLDGDGIEGAIVDGLEHEAGRNLWLTFDEGSPRLDVLRRIPGP